MKIIAYTVVGQYQLQVRFADGKVVTADFTDFLRNSRNPLINQFLSPDLFKTVQLDEFGTLTWGDNEMDINSSSIYEGAFSKQPTQTH